MRRALLVLALLVACPASASAITFTTEGGTVVVRPDGAERLRTQAVAVVPGCGYATAPWNAPVDQPPSWMHDPAGCVVFASRTGPDVAYGFGPGCAEIALSKSPLHLPAANFACALSGVARIEVRGGAGDDEVLFDKGFASPLPVSVALGAGMDRVEARDATLQALDCGEGSDYADEDPGDRSTSCEDGTGVDENVTGSGGGSIAMRDGVAVVDFGARRAKTSIGLNTATEPAGVSVTVDPLPPVGAGCVVRKDRDFPSAACAAPSRVEVRGPDRHRFNLESHLESSVPISVTGGSAADWLRVADGFPTTITACGAGIDRVVVDGADTVAGDCEDVKVTSGSPSLAAPRLGRIRGGDAVHGKIRGRQSQSARIRVACPASARTGCGGIIEGEFAAGRVPFASGAYWVPAGRTSPVDLVVGVGTGRFGAVAEGKVKRIFYRGARSGLRVRVRLRVHARATAWTTVRLGALRRP